MGGIDESLHISVVIPVYNRTDSLLKAVRSVIDQTEPVQEIIVVDDGSDAGRADDTLGPINDDRLKVYRQAHLGVSAARNLGLKAASSPWIALLDSDDHWLPTKTSAQRRFHIDNPGLKISQTGEAWIRDGRRVNPCRYHQKAAGDIFEPSLKRCLISPSAVMFHTDIIDDVGIFDPSLPACEDYDLWLRITSRYHVGLIGEDLTVKTGGHEDQLSRKHWGMDRFRVRSLCKIIDGGGLIEEKEWAARGVLVEKLSILENGARKRGKSAEAEQYSSLRARYAAPRSENLTLFSERDDL